jgi:hypothetical protein
VHAAGVAEEIDRVVGLGRPDHEEDEAEPDHADDLGEHGDVVDARRQRDRDDVDREHRQEDDDGDHEVDGGVGRVEVEDGRDDRGHHHEVDPGGANRQVGQPDETGEPAIGGVHQPSSPLVRITGQRYPRAQLRDDERNQHLPDGSHRPEPDHGRAQVGKAETVVREEPGGDGDDREGDRVEGEEPQRPAELLLVAEGLVDAFVA